MATSDKKKSHKPQARKEATGDDPATATVIVDPAHGELESRSVPIPVYEQPEDPEQSADSSDSPDADSPYPNKNYDGNYKADDNIAEHLNVDDDFPNRQGVTADIGLQKKDKGSKSKKAKKEPGS